MKTKSILTSLPGILVVILMFFASCIKTDPNDSTPQTGTFTDSRDGQVYKTVKLGSQTWFAENLSFETDESWFYEHNNAGYGRLYTWAAAKIACPDGWHLPSDTEWKTLEMFLGMTQSEADKVGWRGTNEARKLKSVTGWDEGINGDGNGIDSVGFAVYPAGYRQPPQDWFVLKDREGYFWTDTTPTNNTKYYRLFHFEFDMISRMYNDPGQHAYSVRCIKD